MLHGGDATADFLTLNAFRVGQHALVTEVAFHQLIGGQRRGVVGRQRDQVVEHTGFAGSLGLELLGPLVGHIGQLGAVVLLVHQVGAIVVAQILAFFLPGIEHLLTEVQGPVERRAVVVNQLGVRLLLADTVDHVLDVSHVRGRGLDPQQVGAVAQAGDTVQYHAVDVGVAAELEQTGGQTGGLEQLAVGLDHDVAVVDLVGGIDVFAFQEAVVLVAQVARLGGHGDLLGQAGAFGVGTGNDHAVVHAQLQERVANRVDLGDEVGVGNGHFTVLVATLLLVGHLVLDLDAARARFDQLLGQQVGGFRVTETGVDVGDDRHNVGLEVVDLVDDLGLLGLVTSGLGVVQITEQVVQFPGVSLLQEGVEFPDQVGDRGFLVHGLVGQRTELGAQRGDHPAGQVQVAAFGIPEVFLDGNHLLLTNEAVPATQGLGVLAVVAVVGRHVLAHDLRVVLGDVQMRFETVLQTHANSSFRVDVVPGFVGTNHGIQCFDVFGV